MLKNAKKLLECIQVYRSHGENELSEEHFEMAQKAQKEIEDISEAIPVIRAILDAHGPTSQPCMALRIAIEKAENWLENFQFSNKEK